MPKHYKEMIDEIINKMDEEAPTNSVAGGGVDMNPDGAVMQNPKMLRRKKEQGAEQGKISKKISKMVKENDDNNNVVLKGVNETLNRLEDKIDEYSGNQKEEIKIVEKKQSFSDKFLKDLMHNTPNSDMFDEMTRGFAIGNSDNVHPIASLGDRPPKGKGSRSSRAVGLVAQKDYKKGKKKKKK